jgi:hypothetical protein
MGPQGIFPHDVAREVLNTDLRWRNPANYRAIHRTYLEPAATQELAAESLDVPFSSYRRHLTAGIASITAWLWQRELHGIDC